MGSRVNGHVVTGKLLDACFTGRKGLEAGGDGDMPRRECLVKWMRSSFEDIVRRF